MEDLKKIQEFFSKPLEENVDKKYSDFLVALRDSGITNMFGAAPYLQAEFGLDKREAREVLANWMRSFGESLKEGKQLDIEDFAKVVQAVTKTGHPVTVLLVPKWNEIEILTGMNAPDDMLFDLSNTIDSLGYGRNDIIIAADSSNLSRREYSDIRRVNGGHKDYFEESLNENEDPIIVKYFKRGDNHFQILVKYERPTGFTTALGSRTALGSQIDQNEAAAQERVKTIVNKLKAEFNLDNIEVSKGQVAGRYYIDAFSDDFREMDVNDLEGSYALNEDKKLTYNDFVRMVRDDMMAGASPDERPSEEQVKKKAKAYYNDYLQGASVDDLFEYNSGIYYDPTKERNAPKAKEASKSALERVKDVIKKIASEQKMGEALSDFEEEEANYDELYSDYKYKVNEAKPKKATGEKISKEVFSKLKGKTINYKGHDYKVVDSDEAVLKIKHLEDGDVTTINLKQFNVSGMIEEILETIELGRQLEEGKLCKKGEAYRKRRMAAGEKSSAYLSGRAVKVCKGQMSGKKKKKKK